MSTKFEILYLYSPQSNTESPPPKVVKKQPPRPLGVEAMKKRKEHGVPGEESNNLMWLLDFKLDFFNEAEASSKYKLLSKRE